MKPTVRVLPEETILQIAQVLPYRTSCHLNWSGIEVHRYRLNPGETPEFSFQQTVIFIPHVDKPFLSEAVINGVRVTRQVDNTTVSILPAGAKIRRRRMVTRELTVIFLDPVMMGEIASVDMPEIEQQFAVVDPLIRSIAMTLDDQLTADFPCPPFYAETLARALAAHIFAMYAKPTRSLGPNRQQLRRSLDFIHNNLQQELTLDEIATVAGMSKFYFAKSFRNVMGISPHRYIVKLRMETARKLLLIEEALSIEEVSLRVGYTDVSHFRTLFRRTTGLSATRYRNR